MKRAIRSLLLGLVWASIWPAYLVLVAQAARLAPWPRNLSILTSTALHGLAVGVFVPGVLAWMTRRDGWTERFLGIPEPVGRQLCRTGRLLSAAAVVLLVPAYLLSSGEFAPGGRPIKAAALCRGFILGFELVVWVSLLRLVRRGSPILDWCNLDHSHHSGDEAGSGSVTSAPEVPSLTHLTFTVPASRHAGWLTWMSRRRQVIAWIIVALAGGIVALDVRGYSFTARRLAVGGAETLALCLLCWSFNRGTARIIDQNARKWGRSGARGPPF